MPTDSDFASFWDARLGACEAALADPAIGDSGISTPVATYQWVYLRASDGATLRARLVCPRAGGRVPCVVMTHDVTCGPRGWHHLTRFVALGYAVLELERRPWSGDLTAGWERGAGSLEMAQLVDDMLSVALLAGRLPRVDGSRLVAWGEGLAGGLAVDVAATVGGIWRVAALNPMPADIARVWEEGPCELVYAGLTRHFREEDPRALHAAELFDVLGYVDSVAFARRLGCEALVGTSMMDTAAIPQSQLSLVRASPAPVRHLTYPKWAHERVNDFEDALLDFLH